VDVTDRAGSIGRAVQSQIYRAGALGRRPAVPVSPDRLERAARRRMSPRAWAYVAGAAGQQRTAQANLDAFDRWRIVPRMLRDVDVRDTTVELFGRRLRAPFLGGFNRSSQRRCPGVIVGVRRGLRRESSSRGSFAGGR
jgi:hypothetical protein